ncbi:hypothetical protein FXF51_17410 [Nonomuraea sp. PA05]|uniref:nSTAND1 domain-containing NTPase n=1 Tax=Nonomuraea sp. PA05 TaxID=2604466 RepID=UPI0011D3EAA3|nr:AAA family ATPase [Nonomuraea sp. PA05]TYB65979.1 hypothetical protein FXF51_17410 [Nonomuraea sp. PA05]
MTDPAGNPFPERGTMSMEEHVRDADILNRTITGPTVELPAVARLTALVGQYLQAPSRGQVAFLHGAHGTGKTHTIRYALGGVTGAIRLYAKAQDGDFHALYQRLMSQVGRDRLRGLARAFQAVLAEEEAGLTAGGPADPGYAARLFTEFLVEPGAVLEAQADELGRVIDDGQEFQRALTSLLEPAMEEAAFAWLAGREVTTLDAARLGVSGPLTDPNQCRYGLQLLTALCAKVGTPVIIVVDQCERLLLGGGANLGVMHSLVERVPQEGGMLLLLGSDAAWEELPEDLRQRFGANHLRTALLTPSQAGELVVAYMGRDLGHGGMGGPFTDDEVLTLLRTSGGNVRRFLQQAWRAFEAATVPAGRDLDPRPVTRLSADRVVEAWLLSEGVGYRRGWRDGDVGADYAVVTPGGPRLLVQISDALFTAPEAAAVLAGIGLVERVRGRGWTARVVLVVAGYANPELSPLLERAAHEVVVLRGEDDLDRLRATVGPLTPGSGPVFTGLPYPGAAPFSQDDAEVFFGREEAVEALVSRLASAREPLVVTGPTGAGTSSLVRAGLLPALAGGALSEETPHWTTLLLTPGTSPLEALSGQLATLASGTGGAKPSPASGLDAATVLASLRERPASARLLLGRPLAAGAGLVLVVDGFEEVFSGSGPEQDLAAFVAALHAVATAPGRAHVVIVVSAAFAGRCQALLGTAEPPYTLPLMGRSQLRRAIIGPAETAGLALEEGLVDAVLADLRTADGAPEPGALPLLAKAMHTIWIRRDGDRLTLRGYAETGGIPLMATSAAEAVHQALTPARQAVARRVLRRLASVTRDGRIKGRPTPLAALRAEHPGGDLEAVLRELAAARVVVVDAGTVRIAHGSLLEDWPRLREWFEADLAGQVLYDQLASDAAEWAENRHSPAFLYRGSRLAAALRAQRQWGRTGLSLEQRARRFLDASGRARRRRRLATALFAGLMSVTVGVLTVDSLSEAARQRAAAQDARTSALLAEQSTLVGDEQVAALLAALAWRFGPGPEARTALIKALGERSASTAFDFGVPAGRSVFRLSGPALAMRAERDGRFVAAVPAGKDAFSLTEVSTGRRIGGALRHEGRVTSMALSADGRILATGDGVARVEDLTGQRLTAELPISPLALGLSADGRTLALGTEDGLWVWAPQWNGLRRLGDRPVAAVAVTPDGKAVAAGDGDGGLVLWDVRAASPALLDEPADAVTSVAFSADGTKLAAGSRSGAVRLWDVPARQALYHQYVGEGDAVTSVAFSVEGTTLATGDDRGNVRLWDVEGPSDLAAAACVLVGRDLTDEEWESNVPGDVRRRPACP